MNPRLSSVIFVIIQLAAVTVLADISEITNGKYISRRNEGRYIPMDDGRYIHVHDMRELGKYIHIPYPYDGGYGPYFGQNIPYDYDPAGEYSSDKFQTVSNPNDPFNTNEYTIPRPEIYLQYGFPQISTKIENDNTDRSASSSVQNSEYKSDTELPCDCPSPNYVLAESKIENAESIADIPARNYLPVKLIIENSKTIPAIPITTHLPAKGNIEIAASIPKSSYLPAKLNNQPESFTAIPERNYLPTKENIQKAASIPKSSDLPAKLNIETKSFTAIPERIPNAESITVVPVNLYIETENPSPIPEIPNAILKRIRKSIFDYSQTQNSLPKPTPRPRKRYDDEGKWKIIRQDENKKETNYEYLYETENGILAKELAVVGRDQGDNSGTSGQGFYQYIGDDDQIYRVEYTVGEQGFLPKLVFPRGKPKSSKST